MKRYILFVCLLALFVVPVNVNAKLCENKTVSEYRALASNVNIYFTYRWEDDIPLFDVIITNIHDELFIVDTVTNKTYKYQQFTSEHELIIRGLSPNQKLKFEIRTSELTCYNQLMDTRIITLPPFNKYSLDPICGGAEEYSLCKRWIATPGSYEDFTAKVKAYKEKRQENFVKEHMNPPKKTLWEIISDFVGNYYVFLVGAIIIVVLIIAAVKNISLKKNQFDFKV